MRHRVQQFLRGIALLSCAPSFGWHIPVAWAQTAEHPSGAARIEPLYAPGLFHSDVAGNRSDPAFEHRPVRLGQVLADLRLTDAVLYDSNLFNAPSQERDDVALVIEPSLDLRTDWPRDALTLHAGARILHYLRTSSEDARTYDLRLSGQRDLDARSAVSAVIHYSRNAEERGLGGQNLIAGGPAFFHRLDGHLAAVTRRGRWQFDLAGRFDQARYEDIAAPAGGRTDQSFRDTRLAGITGRVAYSLTPMLSLLGETDYARTTSPYAIPALRRDADGFTAKAGVRADSHRTMAVQLALGWRTRNYDLPRFRDYRGLTWDATTDWYPARRISLRLQSGQDFRNSNIPEVAGILVRSVSATVYYDVLHRLRLQASLGVENEKYREIHVRTSRWTAAAEAEYAIGPRLSTRLFLRGRERDSNDQGRFINYSGFTSGISITGWL